MTDAHVAAIRRFMDETGIAAPSVDLIGLHGQTVYHRPEIRFTRQLAELLPPAIEVRALVLDNAGQDVRNRPQHGGKFSSYHARRLWPRGTLARTNP